jgi:tetratricopeptide (TPR) repeat protein
LKTLIKWLVVLTGLILLSVVLFSAYANFFLDYSLERLEIAMDATGKKFDSVSPVSRTVYRDVLKDMAVEESAREKIDFQNVALLEMASNSLAEATEDKSYERARYYLNQVMQSKLESRPMLLQIMDRLYFNFQKTHQQIMSFMDYVSQRVLKIKPPASKAVEYSSILLLNQAEESLKNGKLEESAGLYRKYLDRYPGQTEKGFVSITLADIYLKLDKAAEARPLLESVCQSFAGREEAQLAANMLKKILEAQRKIELADQLKNAIPEAQQKTEGQAVQLKLALAQLAAYQPEKAREILTPLAESTQPEIRKKAKFYLGWIYKLESRYDQSATVLTELLNDPELDQEMKIGLQSQLADIYYQQGNVEKSLGEYKNVAKTSGAGATGGIRDVWVSLAELERAKIYHYDYENITNIEQLQRRLNDLELRYGDKGNLREVLENIPDLGLREKAFYELENGRVHMALDLFEKDAAKHPRDAWTQGGLGIVYVLLGDIEKGHEFARQSYELNHDYYTAAVMGYLSTLLGKYEEAEAYYQECLGQRPDYLPGKFNLASIYLKTGKFQQALGLLGRLEKEIDESQKLVRAKIMNNMGFAYWQLGDRANAETKFRQALEAMPNFAVAKNNLTQLAAGETPQMVTLRE